MRSYSDREIEHMQEEITEKLNTIIEQLRCTNGRIKTLELWKSYQLGALSVLTALLLPIAFIVFSSTF
jgi:hypothetical protein